MEKRDCEDKPCEENGMPDMSDMPDMDDVVGSRYLAPELSPIWSRENRILIMRQLWLALAKAQKKLGLNDISDEGIEEMTQQLRKIDLERIDAYEAEVEYSMIQDMEKYIEEKENERTLEHEREIEKMRKDGVDEAKIEEEIEKEREMREQRRRDVEEIREMRAKEMMERRERKENQKGGDGEKKKEGDDGTSKERMSEQKKRKGSIEENMTRNVTKEVIMNLKAYEDLCPNAKGFMHKGASNKYISENCDLILMKKSLNVLVSKLFLFINFLMKQSHEFIDKALLAHTNYHKTHIITLGKRIAMWNSDLMDIFDQWAKLSFPFRGIRGDMPIPARTSPSRTYMQPFMLFDGDVKLCNKLNTELAREFNFSPNKVMITSGKTQMRVFDVHMIHLLSKLSQGLYKIMNDVNVLVTQEEAEEGVPIKKGKRDGEDGGEGGGEGKEDADLRCNSVDSSDPNRVDDLRCNSGDPSDPNRVDDLRCNSVDPSDPNRVDDSEIFRITPMTIERVCSLNRYVILQELGMAHTYVSHWLDQSLDDTSIKKIVIPEIFLLTEHIIDCSYIIFNKLIFHMDVIDENVCDFIQHIVREEFVLRGEERGVPRKEIEDRLKKVFAEYEKFEKMEREREEREKEEMSKHPEMSEGFMRMRASPSSLQKYDIDVKTRQQRAKVHFRSDPLLYKLIDLPPMALNLISLDPKDFIGSAPMQVFQLNHFFSNKTSSLFWIK
jgi:adenylosuccinate lyase